MRNSKKNKNRRRYTTFGFENEKSSILAKNISEFFFIIKAKTSLSTSVFILSTISQCLKTKFYIFWTQTCRNWTKLFTWTNYISKVSHALKTTHATELYLLIGHSTRTSQWVWTINSNTCAVLKIHVLRLLIAWLLVSVFRCLRRDLDLKERSFRTGFSSFQT